MTRSPLLPLREPQNHVSPRAIGLWRCVTLMWAVPAWIALVVAAVCATVAVEESWRWAAVAGCLLIAVVPAIWLTVVPRLLYAIHRWEVTEIALYVRHGLFWRTTEIVPISRIQTVDSTQGPIMRFFDLRTVTISTASTHSTVVIPFLDSATAYDVVANLVAITGAESGDAT